VCQDDESELPPADRAAGALFERALAATTAKPIRCSPAEPAAAPASAVADADGESVWLAWLAWTVMRGAEWRTIDRSA
jgi:hypothetical protein